MPSTVPRKPVLTSDWWRVAHNPELPEIDSPKGEVVDHCVFRAADGRWQLWTQIRGASVGRIFYRWQGSDDLTDENWEPIGICWEADRGCGESWDTGEDGWIHAPYVCRIDDQYVMYYGGGPSENGDFQICAATSGGGIQFERALDEDGKSGMFTGPGVVRDPMVIRSGNDYIMYYAADEGGTGVIAARTSPDPLGRDWSDYRVVSRGGICGTARASQQCPFVVHIDGLYYLFKMAGSDQYRTVVYRSEDPLDFGQEDDRLVAVLPSSASEIILDDDRYYVSSLIPGYEGVRLARLEWQEEALDSTCVSFRPGSAG